jgi:tetratricopeptide (TPR) repeat protein
MKRTERHHLKEDEIVSGFHRFVEFYKTWQREVLITAAVAGLVALVFGVLLLVRSHNRAVESRLVGDIVGLSADLDAKPENVARLEALAGKGGAGRLASLELAAYYAAKGDDAKAEALAGGISAVPKDLLYYQAQDLLAQVLVRKKDYAGAITIYKKIQEQNPEAYPLDAIMYHLAEAYELKGDTKEALDLYQKLQADFAQSYYGYEASLKVGRLGLQK